MAKNTNKNAKSGNNGRQYFNLDEDTTIFEEVDEELRNEKFKQFMNKYGGSILSVVVLALAITVGYEKIAQWRISKAEQKIFNTLKQ